MIEMLDYLCTLLHTKHNKKLSNWTYCSLVFSVKSFTGWICPNEALDQKKVAR